jgi:hypothetical protein
MQQSWLLILALRQGWLRLLSLIPLKVSDLIIDLGQTFFKHLRVPNLARQSTLCVFKHLEEVVPFDLAPLRLVALPRLDFLEEELFEDALQSIHCKLVLIDDMREDQE